MFDRIRVDNISYITRIHFVEMDKEYIFTSTKYIYQLKTNTNLLKIFIPTYLFFNNYSLLPIFPNCRHV